MIKDLLNEIGPWLNGGLLLTIAGYFLYKRKNNAEASKVENESIQISTNKEISLVKFYQEQVLSLTQKYEELEKKFEEKEQENMNCEARIIDLETKYTALLSRVTLLSKNIKS